MFTTLRIILYTICVNIIQICFGSGIVSLMGSGGATILEHMTDLHVHALHLIWQLSNIPRQKYMEYDRLKDTCTGCDNVYNTEDDILHDMWKHHVTGFFFYLCGVWFVTSFFFNLVHMASISNTKSRWYVRGQARSHPLKVMLVIKNLIYDKTHKFTRKSSFWFKVIWV